MIADARRWELPPDEIEALRALLSAGQAGHGFSGVWPHNRVAVAAFLAGASQWRTALGVTERGLRTLWIGLDYAGVKVALEPRGIVLDAATMAGLQAMEAAARDVLNGADR